jgi:hypothetical protein
MGRGNVYNCDRCGVVQEVDTVRLRFYALDKGESLPVLGRIAWCSECDGVTQIEVIIPLEKMEEILANRANVGVNDKELQRRAKEWNQDIAEFVAESIARLRIGIEWRRKRESPPRCLKCGTTAVNPIGDWDKIRFELEHPGCGGMFQYDGWIGFSESKQLFSPEGLRLNYK